MISRLFDNSMLELLRSQHLFVLKLASVEKVVLHHLLGDTSRIIQLQLVPGILDDAYLDRRVRL
jgi:hypothetical protein